jgi:hypothetical protein
LSYAGISKNFHVDVSNQNIIAVLTSLSKPFGLFYYRVGFTFSREPIDSLFPNIWFKNIFSLKVASETLRHFAPDKLLKKYSEWQREIIEAIRKTTGLPIIPSDVVILATLDRRAQLNSQQEQLVAKYKRGEGYRFCLTPYFLEKERGGANEKGGRIED